MEIKIYEAYEDLPGFKVFDCTLLKATLSPKACAAHWKSQKYIQCASCEIGSHFAGGTPPKKKPSTTCIRCGKKSRLISRCFCVSCRNRAAEVWAGQNAKKCMPVKWPQLLRRGYAIIGVDSATQAHSAAYQCESNYRGVSPQKRPQRAIRPYLPSLEILDHHHLWLSCWTTGEEELAAVAQRLIPDHSVVDIEVSEPLASLE